MSTALMSIQCRQNGDYDPCSVFDESDLCKEKTLSLRHPKQRADCRYLEIEKKLRPSIRRRGASASDTPRGCAFRSDCTTSNVAR